MSESLDVLDSTKGKKPQGPAFLGVLTPREPLLLLMFAAAEGHADVVRTLLRYGSDPGRALG